MVVVVVVVVVVADAEGPLSSPPPIAMAAGARNADPLTLLPGEPWPGLLRRLQTEEFLFGPGESLGWRRSRYTEEEAPAAWQTATTKRRRPARGSANSVGQPGL